MAQGESRGGPGTHHYAAKMAAAGLRLDPLDPQYRRMTVLFPSDNRLCSSCLLAQREVPAVGMLVYQGGERPACDRCATYRMAHPTRDFVAWEEFGQHNMISGGGQ
jgi:hypothetical protein